MTRDELIKSNLGLVRACSKRFTGKGVEYEELYSAGCLGLVKAVDRYDESRGCAFSTYAVPVILGEIRLLFREGGSVKLSRSLQELSVRARRIAEEHLDRTGESIKTAELAEKLGVDVYKAQEALNASRAVISLNRTQDSGDSVIEIPVPSAEESLTDRLSLIEVIESLSIDERELIRLRYFKQKTQTETAAILNTTQVQISRREKKILTKMRAMLV